MEPLVLSDKGTVVITAVNPEHKKEDGKKIYMPSEIADSIEITVGKGVKNDRHYTEDGLRTSGIRELEAFGIARKSDIFNWREISIVSEEERKQIQKLLGLPHMPYGALGENLVIQGIRHLTQLPPRSLLHFWDKEGEEKRSAIICVWGENKPCHIPGQMLQYHFPEKKDLPAAFQRLGERRLGLRGLVGFTFQNGSITSGDIVRVQRP